MRLYTEEQVREAMIEARLSPWLKTDFWLQALTPIELPSEEEIDKASPSGTNNSYEIGLVCGFQQGAEWVINQIKQQDNGQN